ncbi:hypothetical protein FB451DRAFT_363865 [Mycena latifolia]|nr:hypothetical protein FB451DRAFT_363865 [Mycena latifolia]
MRRVGSGRKMHTALWRSASHQDSKLCTHACSSLLDLWHRLRNPRIWKVGSFSTKLRMARHAPVSPSTSLKHQPNSAPEVAQDISALAAMLRCSSQIPRWSDVRRISFRGGFTTPGPCTSAISSTNPSLLYVNVLLTRFAADMNHHAAGSRSFLPHSVPISLLTPLRLRNATFAATLYNTRTRATPHGEYAPCSLQPRRRHTLCAPWLSLMDRFRHPASCPLQSSSHLISMLRHRTYAPPRLHRPLSSLNSLPCFSFNSPLLQSAPLTSISISMRTPRSPPFHSLGFPHLAPRFALHRICSSLKLCPSSRALPNLLLWTAHALPNVRAQTPKYTRITQRALLPFNSIQFNSVCPSSLNSTHLESLALGHSALPPSSPFGLDSPKNRLDFLCVPNLVYQAHSAHRVRTSLNLNCVCGTADSVLCRLMRTGRRLKIECVVPGCFKYVRKPRARTRFSAHSQLKRSSGAQAEFPTRWTPS